jgi:4-methylaminobutanoate oxidase (formaldehyde-forming)
MTSFGKIRVEGRDACAFLNRVCANQMDVAAGRIVYTQMLNAAGGIESDLTVTRLSETAFLMVVPGATLQRDLAWLRRHLGDEFVTLTDMTAAESVLCVMGPKSRALLQAVSPADFSNEAHPFGLAKGIEIGMGLARAHRVTYVGELGWELYVSSDQAAHVFEALEAADKGMKLCGLHVLDSCRIEKGYRHFGHDITDEDHVLEAGLGFAVKTGKGEFIGRDAVLRKREAGLDRRMVQFKLRDPDPLLFHNEAIVRDGRIVGPITSGNYGHHLGGAIGLGYVPCKGESVEAVMASSYEIEVAGKRYAADASLEPMYDPKSERVRM